MDDNIKAGNSIVADRAVDPRAFDWETAFPAVMADGGFDVVLGNPPYVRQELLSPFKPYLQTHYACYDGVADLYVYFYERGVKLLKSGGMLSYIVTNKWLRSGYGEPLRKFFVEQTIFEQIIDFGHAPIFRDADTFPCIIVLQKADLNLPDANATDSSIAQSPDSLAARGLSPLLGPGMQSESPMVTVCAVPREQLEGLNLAQFVEREGYEIPRSRLSAAAWSLENPQVDALMQKIRSVGVPLVDFAGTKPYYGIKTGFNEAFLIDDQTRQRLISEDPKCSEIIKPYLRGQDIERWNNRSQNNYIILIKSSNNQRYPWSSETNEYDAELVFSKEYASLYKHLQVYKASLKARSDKGKFWWELRNCAYYSRFEDCKIFYQVIQTLPQYSLDQSGRFGNDKTFFLPSSNQYLLAVLNSPLIWSYSHRNFTRMLSGAISPMGYLFEQLPIAPPTEPIRREAEDLVSELIELTKANQEAQRDVMGWLAFEFNIDKPGQKLADFAQLSLDEFRAELKKRCPKGTSIGPKQVKAIDLAYSDYATPIQQRNTEILRREQRLSDLVNQAYQLTPEEIELLWKTAPPRMPIAPLN